MKEDCLMIKTHSLNQKINSLNYHHRTSLDTYSFFASFSITQKEKGVWWNRRNSKMIVDNKIGIFCRVGKKNSIITLDFVPLKNGSYKNITRPDKSSKHIGNQKPFFYYYGLEKVNASFIYILTPEVHRSKKYAGLFFLIMWFKSANQNARKISTSLFHPSLSRDFKEIERALRQVSHLPQDLLVVDLLNYVMWSGRVGGNF